MLRSFCYSNYFRRGLTHFVSPSILLATTHTNALYHYRRARASSKSSLRTNTVSIAVAAWALGMRACAQAWPTACMTCGGRLGCARHVRWAQRCSTALLSRNAGAELNNVASFHALVCAGTAAAPAFVLVAPHRSSGHCRPRRLPRRHRPVARWVMRRPPPGADPAVQPIRNPPRLAIPLNWLSHPIRWLSARPPRSA